MIYFACLPISFAPFSGTPLCGGIRRKLMKQAKGNAKSGKYLISMRGDNHGTFAGSGGLGFFSSMSCIQLEPVQELYSPAFRGSSGNSVWVGTFIGIDSVEGFYLPYGRHTTDHLCIPSCGCEVIVPDNELLPQGSLEEILPKGGG